VEASARELVVRVVREHADSLLRIARRHTLCAADAEDAYQRALEIFVKNAHRLDAEGAHKWLHVVVRHEALAVRRARSSLVGVEDEAALDALDDARHVASVEERSERMDDLGRAAEALQRLKPQEVTALWLKAEGLSYEEIAERQGWTYTKVNRCITEGRRAFLRRYAGIQAGEECERWADVLSAIADGEATQQQLLDARPHLRNCSGCRATLAAMRDSGRAVAALLPVGALAADAASVDHAMSFAAALHDRVAAAAMSLQERVAAVGASLHERAAAAGASLHERAASVGTSVQERAAAAGASLHDRAASVALKTQAAADAVVSGKFAAVAASTAALAGGGVAAERHFGEDDARAAPAAPAIVRADPAPAEPSPPSPSGASRPAAVVAAAAGAASGGAATARIAAPEEHAGEPPDAAAFAVEAGEAPSPDAAAPRRPEAAAAGGGVAAAAERARDERRPASQGRTESGGEFGFVPAER
jgi:RNA polymerase sigma factor (sigma-70 family)